MKPKNILAFNKWFDIASIYWSRIISSNLISIILILFLLVSVAFVHLKVVFGSIWIAISIQSIVLLVSVNHKRFPKIKGVSVLPLILTLFNIIYIYISYVGSLEQWNLTNFIKSVGIGVTEYILAFIFSANKDSEIEQYKEQIDVNDIDSIDKIINDSL